MSSEAPEEVIGRTLSLLRGLAKGEPVDEVEIGDIVRRLVEARDEIEGLRSRASVSFEPHNSGGKKRR